MSSEEAMGKRTTLRDVMLRRYLRLGETHTLSEVMGFLADTRFEASGLPFLVVIGQEGQFVGMLSPKTIFKAFLVEGYTQSEDILKNSNSILSKTVGQVMTRDIPRLDPNAFLEDGFLCIKNSQSEAAAVIEEDRIIGLVTARILFEHASTLTVGALSGGVIPPASAKDA